MRCWLCLVIATAMVDADACKPNCPVLLVGGLSGSTLEASVSDRNPPVSGCKSNADWYTLWASTFSILDKPCFNANAALRYDDNGAGGQRKLMNASGVSVRAVAGLAGNKKIWTVQYYATMLKELEANGYREGESVFGYTYDWRVTGEPGATAPQLIELRRAVERASAANSGRPVHIVTHSLGVALVQTLLNGASAVGDSAWKRQYVRSVTYLAPALKGATGALQGIIMGPQLSTWLPQFVNDWVVPATRTMPSMLYMSPQPHDADFWNEQLQGRPFIENEETGRTYGLGDSSALMEDLGAPVLREAWDKVSAASNVAPVSMDPMLPTLCAFANDSQTTLRMKFKTAKFTKQTVVEAVPGDATVTAESMRWCGRWANATVKEYILNAGEGAHVKTASDKAVVHDVVQWLLSFNS